MLQNDSKRRMERSVVKQGGALRKLPDSEGSCVTERDEGRIECYWNTAVAKLCQKLFRKLMTTDHHAIEDP